MTAVNQEMGWLRSLRSETLGSVLVADAAAGATVLAVNDAVDFDPAGGVLSLNGAKLTFATADPDADTITLAAPLATAAAINDPVNLWDTDNDAVAAEIVASVELINVGSDDDPIEARLAQGLGGYLPLGARGERGETVVLEQYGGRWRVVDVVGKDNVLETTWGDPLGQHLTLGRDGIRGYAIADNPATPDEVELLENFRYDVATGDVTVIGELGTARPGDVGIFLFSNRFSYAGVAVTRPTMQFNVGATRDQPSIQADNVLQAGLFMYSGANVSERESWLLLNNGSLQLGIEGTANSGVAGTQFNMTTATVDALTSTGARLQANTNQLLLQSSYNLGGGGALAAIVWNVGDFFQAGFRSAGGVTNLGLQVDSTGLLRLCTAGSGLEIVSGNGTAYRDLKCRNIEYTGTLTPPSDRRLKQDIVDADLDALEVVRSAPVYEWAYKAAPGERRLGVMADDLPAILTRPLGGDYVSADPELGVSLTEQIAVMWRALQQTNDRIDHMEGSPTT